jgi:hypothetical protein
MITISDTANSVERIPMNIGYNSEEAYVLIRRKRARKVR